MLMKTPFILVIFLILLDFSSCFNATRIFMHTNQLPDKVDEIIEYIGIEYSIELEKVELTDSSRKGLTEMIKKVSDAGNDTMFAYLPDVNVTLLNEIARQYDVYVWNAIAYPERVCLSNVVLGYDAVSTSLLSMLYSFI